ncbi:MAG: MOSC domain-containing protein [Chitinophagales bacterium]
MKKSIKELFATLPQIGQVAWISIRPQKRGDLEVVESVEATTETGLVGDHYHGSSGKRQVTLIQGEHLDGIASMLGKSEIDPLLLRRNIVVRGINLLALKDQQFRIGEAVLETTGLCHPCSRMEENLGDGGYNAVRGHGGITARVVKSGRIGVGDEVAKI